MTKQDDGLFLLEVLIDKIVFVKSPCFSDKDFRTCVNVECPDVEPLEICDDDPGACIAKSGGPFVKTFNSGKSCLFSLKEADISKAMSKYLIKICVYKSLPCGCLPTKIVMGEATIDMTKEFVQARRKFLEDPTSVSYQALKDSFRIVGPDGTETGDIVMFLRISCFGKLIITRFQGASGPPKLGTGAGPSIVDRSCNPQKDFQSPGDPCACGAARSGGGGGGGAGTGGQPCSAGGGGGGGYGVCPITRDPYNSMPCQDPDDPCFCSGPKPETKQQMSCRNTDQYCLHVPKDCCPTGNKVIFQLPLDSCSLRHKQRAHFNFTSDGVGDVARDEPGQLMPTTAEEYPGVVYDFPKQVIKLRIGKTVELPNRKSTLEYQFITPVATNEKTVPVNDTRTAQCAPCNCSACCPSKFPKRALLSLPFSQELTEQQKMELKSTSEELKLLHIEDNYNNTISQGSSIPCSATATKIFDKNLQALSNNIGFINNHMDLSVDRSVTSLCPIRSKRHSVSFCNTVNWAPKSHDNFASNLIKKRKEDETFGEKETTVYMTLFDNFCRRRTSGTQATASINKCLQVGFYRPANLRDSTHATNSNCCSTYSTSTFAGPDVRRRIPESLRNSDVYFFGKKKDESKRKPDSGMGSTSKPYRSGIQVTAAPVKSELSTSNTNVKSTSSVQAKSQSSSTAVQTRQAKGSCAGTCTSKAVYIKDDKCPAVTGTKGDIVATVSHIRIGPRDPCPVHGKEPCQGPKCILASSGEQQAPVKVTTMANPRRGVFELVIRKMNGAPLATNELMLEWTPPPNRPPPCGSPCPVPCAPAPCRPSKCKMILCKLPKCCRKPCKKPCGPPSPCRPCRPCKRPCGPPCPPPPCRKCCKPSCCGKPCRRSKTASSPPRCKPCTSSPCSSPCSSPPCPSPCATPCIPCCKPPRKVPCKSSPCLRPCPVVVGRKRTRKARSQPKIKSHKKRISPCWNRTSGCPVVRCRSVPVPCFACYGISLCRPRRCCSVFPCKVPKFCKSDCSTCC